MKNRKSPHLLTVGGLFSGVGGIELGFQKAGFELSWSNEIDKAASTTFSRNFQHLHIQEDVHNLKAKALSPVDVLVGGFPCQAFSVAGYRKGFDDDRGNLFFQIERLIKEQRRVYGFKPRALLLENVKNFYTHDHGNTFKVVLERLNKLGYFVFHGVLNTSSITGIPQNRERIFLICFDEGAGNCPLHFDGLISNAPLLPGMGGGLFDDSMPMSKTFHSNLPFKSVRQPAHISKYLEGKRVEEKYYYREDRYMYKELQRLVQSTDTVYQWRRQYVRENKSNVCPTLTANMGTGGHNVPLVKDDYGIRKLTPRECFNLQGFPKSFKLPAELPDSQLYKQAGNSVTVTLIEKLARLMRESIVRGES